MDPDDAFSSIPYEKGSRFLVLLERTVGRARWDAFVRAYLARFRFTSITSEEFMDFLEAHLPGTSAAVEAPRWLYEAGIPGNAPVFRSAALDSLTALAEGWPAGRRPSPKDVAGWDSNHLLLYLQHLPREMDTASCRWLDETLQLTGRGNYEVLAEWLAVAAGSDYEPAFPRLREVLTTLGRVKYLRPLYTALGRHPRTRALAREVFAAASPRYHSLSRRVSASVIELYEDASRP